MRDDALIIAQDQYYSMDPFETKLNNNVLVVGASGSGKTRSIVTPNLLQASGSYIISDPKGNLCKKYGRYLINKGYTVRKLDFTNPRLSAHYNFFRYIRSRQDIVKIAHMLIYQRKKTGGNIDPFWDEASQLLLQAVMAYLFEAWTKKEQNLHRLLELISMCQIDENMEETKNPLDILMEDLGKKNKDSYALNMYTKFRVAANRTLRSILITVNARLGLYDTPELNMMMKEDDQKKNDIEIAPTI